MADPAPRLANDLQPLAEFAHGIRRRVAALTIEKGGCYLSQACSSAEVLAVLFGQAMRLGPSIAPADPPDFAGVPRAGMAGQATGEAWLGAKAADLDRFYLSPSHYCVALYAALIEAGRLDPAALVRFNMDGGTLEMIGAEHSPGMGLTTGSFGQALSQVAGIALGRRLRGETRRNWLFMSDGEFNEGQVWEALTFCAMHRLTEITVVVDVNGQQVDGLTDEVFPMGDLGAKLSTFGADVRRVDGHDLAALVAAMGPRGEGGPVVILAMTDPAQGIAALNARKPDLHYVALRGEADRAELQAWLEKEQADA